MVAKKPRNTKRSNALVVEAPSSEEPFDMVLTDFRVIKLLSERFMVPEDAKRGTYSTTISESRFDISATKEGSYGMTVTYCIEIIGYRVDNIDDKIGGKSFSLSATVEGNIEYVGGKPNGESVDKNSKEIIRIVHALTMNKLKEEAVNLGYRTVKPSLGLFINEMPKLTFNSAIQ